MQVSRLRRGNSLGNNMTIKEEKKKKERKNVDVHALA
jgi:hypothetical protein